VVASPDTLATILYTSGSTGVPKGVAQNHRGTLHNALKHQQYLGLVPEDRLALILAGSTVGSVRDLMAALTTGASIHPFDVRAGGFTALADWIQDRRITYVNMVVTLFRHFVAALPSSARFPSVRVVRSGSERMAPMDLEAFRRHFPSTAVFYTGLGTTETGSVTGVLFSADTPVSDGGVGVGGPLQDMEVLALDEAGRPLPGGEVGEIAVRSRYLALGYWRRPDLSAPVFRPDPEGGDARIYLTGDLGRLHPDGSLELLGRQDDQVKVRGHKVVLTEVEQALLALPGVRQAAVLLRESRAGEPKLVGYVAMTGEPPGPEDLRRALQARLPAHMIPAIFMTLPVLPSTPGGKLDRRALPEPDWEPSASGTAPRTPLEARLATLWAEALGVDAVGVTDTFASLGGDSLLAMRLVSTICAELQLPLRPSTLLVAGTVADMAIEVTAALLEQAPASVRETLLDAKPPPRVEHRG
jgi:acyl-coenzyme A synthetase/AMP-(fatty) acid ligase